jgi:hypothetical protein
MRNLCWKSESKPKSIIFYSFLHKKILFEKNPVHESLELFNWNKTVKKAFKTDKNWLREMKKKKLFLAWTDQLV